MTGSAALAFANACLTLCALTCATLGFAAIRGKQIARHKRLMLAAFGFSCVFMVTFITRVATYGLAEFRGKGAARVAYYGVFASHDGLAVVSVPLILVTLGLGLAGRIEAHREVAQLTLPIWVYVATTGLVLYALLYVV